LVVVAASYRWELLRERLGTNYRGCALEWSIEAQPLGTGGAMRQAFQAFDLERAFVLNADTLFRIDLRALEARHTATGAAVTVALRQVEDVGRYGEVIVAAEGRITQFREKGGQGPGLINGGIYLVDSSVWRQEASPAAFSFERDFLQVRVAEERLFGLGFDAYFIDIGIPEDLDRARRDLGAS
jgi:NDP-sugar pyrophosphorylase family protein